MLSNIQFHYSGPVLPAIFKKRINRFVALVELKGQEVFAHIKNTGRMRELLIPGEICWLEKAKNPNRKTNYDLIAIRSQNTIVNLDSLLPNFIVGRILEEGLLPDLNQRKCIIPERMTDHSRLDFLVEMAAMDLYIEVKGVNLVTSDGLALFPDAVTARGTRHLEKLMELRRAGNRAAIVFIVQRSDARTLKAHRDLDPVFAETLERACQIGVEVYAFTLEVEPGRVNICREITVEFTA